MEDNTLNFDQPFLSVRRRMPTLIPENREEQKTNVPRPAIPRLPQHRSELKSGPLRNPGSVPFLWEQTPGRPKEETRPNTENHNRPPIAPKLPPGRYPKANPKDRVKLSPNTTVGRNQAVNVPSSDENRRETFDVSDENVKNVKSSKEAEESSDSGDTDAFVDALDTLSRTESSFLNCSVSGLNELENFDVESSRTFSTDPQAQKFMMDRFLPAAKAMASDRLHYAPKRQLVAQEEPKELKNGVNQYKPSLRYGPSFAKRYSEYSDNQEVEDSEDDDNDQRENISGVCGLLPRFCLKGSIGRLNPVPGMSVRTRVPKSSYKAQRRSSSSDSYSKMDTESRSDRTERKSVEKFQAEEFKFAPWLLLETKEVPCGREEQTDAHNNDLGLYEKGFKTFQEVLAEQDSQNESHSVSPVAEKTLYVDTVQNLESPNTQGTKGLPTLKEDHRADSTAADFKKLDDVVDGRAKLVPNAQKCDDSNIPSSLDEPNGTHGMDTQNASTTAQTTEPLKEETNKLKKESPSYSELLAPPPLPKSPSDSWLLRTLPGISKNSSLHSHLGAAKNPENHGSNASTNDVKWETIVKTTKLHHSVGLLTTIPEA